VHSFRPGGRLVLALEVGRGDTPHALFPSKPEFYVRRSGSTFRATRDEVMTLVMARLRNEQPRGPFSL
jgi:hypothetical protein